MSRPERGRGWRPGGLVQRGGFAVGLVVGLLVGLGVALGVALYVNKVPIPFVNKVNQRTPEQDAAEVERNRNWDPNAPLAGKVPAPRGTAAAPVAPPTPAAASMPARSTALPASAAVRDPAAILAGQSPPTASPARSTKAGAEPFTYFVQVGAYGRPEDAEQQRARLAMLGLGAKVSEREQAGRTVYRVRLGPYDNKDEADTAQERLQGSGVDSALVRIER